MSRSKAPLYVGLTAAGGLGYYLYSAGGDPKVAQKQAETDLHKASAKVKSELPGRGQQAEKETERLGAKAGAKFDNAVEKTETYAKHAKADAMKKVDEIDRKVEAEASKTKSSVSSWFGGGK